jgi:FMN phosphatase YigB (HAD superfamily)
MLVSAISLDFWGTIARPNPLYSAARTEYFSELFGVEPEVAHAKYIQVKRHADTAAENFGVAYHPLAQIRMLMNERLTRRVDATDVFHDIMSIVAKNPPIVEESMYSALRRTSTIFVIGITSNTNFIPGRMLDVLIPDYFAKSSWSDQVGMCKPSSEIFNETRRSMALRKGLTLYPQDIIHIGDNYKCDYLGATRYGFQGCKVSDPADTEKKLITLINNGEIE